MKRFSLPLINNNYDQNIGKIFSYNFPNRDIVYIKSNILIRIIYFQVLLNQ